MNLKQKQAVEAPLQPVFVVAGAGTGKTKTLISRIVYLIHHYKIDPKKILVITFTNKACEEIQHRINIESTAPSHIFTFHGFFYFLLKQDIKHLNPKYDDFGIADVSYRRSIVRKHLQSLQLDLKVIAPRTVLGLISELKIGKELGLDISKLVKKLIFEERIKDLSGEVLLNIFQKYEESLRELNYLDFDDLEVFTYRLLKLENIRNKWIKFFDSINIDEFQDTSVLQFEIVKQLAPKKANLFVVGDPDQSIYGFRGAKPRVCEELVNHYKPDLLYITLDQNYRCTKNILKVANTLIQKNNDKFAKKLWTDNEEGASVCFKKFNSSWQEAAWILDEVERLKVLHKTELKNFAILYRTNFMSKPIEFELSRRAIPYKLSNSVEFMDRLEIKFIISYLNIIYLDAFFSDQLQNIKKMFGLEGIGVASLDAFVDWAKSNNYLFQEAIANLDKSGLNKKRIDVIRDFGNTVLKVSKKKKKDLCKFVEYLMDEIGFTSHCNKNKESERINNILLFIEGLVKNNPSLSNEELVKKIPLGVSDISSDDKDYLLLSTIHSAKGLEYDFVFLIGLLDGSFPLLKQDEKEERRMAYVAFTRAKKRLYLSASPKESWGVSKLSKFLFEIMDYL